MTASEDFVPEEPPIGECHNCGEERVLTSVADGYSYDEQHRWRQRHHMYCEECFFHCNECDEPTPETNRYPSPLNGRAYCEDCYCETHNTCERCDDTIWAHQSNYPDFRDGPYCDDCLMVIEDEYYGGDCDYEHPSNVIRSYSTKLGSVFRHWDTVINDCVLTGRGRHEIPYLGFELETNMREGSGYELRERGAIALRDASPDDYLIMKEDGSISGFEIVTEPCDYRTHLELFPWHMLNKLATDFGMTSWRGGGAGLHVHISKSSFSKLHLGAFLQFHDKNIKELVKLAGRESTYSKFGRTIRDWNHDVKMDRVKQAMGLEVNGDRYVAVNLQNRNTVELRYFRGSLKEQTVKGVLEFTHSLWQYTKQTKFTSLDSHKNILWPAYREWLFAQPEFTHAQSLVTTRGL